MKECFALPFFCPPFRFAERPVIFPLCPLVSFVIIFSAAFQTSCVSAAMVMHLKEPITFLVCITETHVLSLHADTADLRLKNYDMQIFSPPHFLILARTLQLIDQRPWSLA